MSRDDKTSDVSSPSTYAAGWAMPASIPEVPLEAMHIVEEAPAPFPEPTPPIAVGWTEEAAGPRSPDDATYAERFDVGPPSGPEPSAPVIASALLNEPQ
ncbi:MAG TPA: hypothetical protein VKH44_12640, partial [Pirellulaceae bacterium]|nr:hypothetical protein [Pirellulaceae bacterium]